MGVSIPDFVGAFGSLFQRDLFAFEMNHPEFGCRFEVPVFIENIIRRQQRLVLNPDLFAVDRGIRTPYMQNYNLNIEQQLMSKVGVSVAYVGSQGRKPKRESFDYDSGGN